MPGPGGHGGGGRGPGGGGHHGGGPRPGGGGPRPGGHMGGPRPPMHHRPPIHHPPVGWHRRPRYGGCCGPMVIAVIGVIAAVALLLL